VKSSVQQFVEFLVIATAAIFAVDMYWRLELGRALLSKWLDSREKTATFGRHVDVTAWSRPGNT
jgi:hypothetical protein